MATFLDIFYKKHGAPKQVLSDNGKEFTAAEVNDLHKKLGIQITHGMPYHPQTQGNWLVGVMVPVSIVNVSFISH